MQSKTPPPFPETAQTSLVTYIGDAAACTELHDFAALSRQYATEVLCPAWPGLLDGESRATTRWTSNSKT